MRYGIIFLILGLFLIAGGWLMESIVGRVFSLYSAIGFVALGLGYLLESPVFWMKRQDGTINPLGYLLYLPLRGLNWVSLRLAIAGKQPAIHNIAPNLWLGRRLFTSEARALVASEEWAIVDLTCEFAEVGALRNGSYLCLPTLDHTAPTPDQIRRALAFIEAEKPFRKVFVHCALGHGRSATVVAAWLLQNGAVQTAAEANEYIKRIRSGVRLKPDQLRVLDEMFSKK